MLQLFLEQLAKGWDLHIPETPDRAKLAQVPDNLARKLISRGAFSFAADTPRLPPFQLLLERPQWPGDIPDQHVAQAEVWEAVGPRPTPERLASLGSTRQACDCSRRLSRAVEQLGLESQVADASYESDARYLHTEVERLAAVAAAVLTYSMAVYRVLAETTEDLWPADHEPAEATLNRV